MFFLQDSFNNSIEKISNKFLNKIKYGSLNVIYPSKKSLEYNGEKDGYNANIVIHNFKFFSKVFKKGSIGFAESYIDGDFSTSNFGWFVFLAAVPTMIGHNIFYFLVKTLSATTIAAVPLGEPVISSIGAFFLFNEPVGFFVFLGGLITLLGVYIIIKNDG